VLKRQPCFVNQFDIAAYPWLAATRTHAALAAPISVSGELIGVITFLRSAPEPGFDEDAVAKVTILAAQLGTALEALRLNQLSREEHRRASILVEVATALNGLPDTAAVMESIADRLRVLLRSPAVLVFVQQE
jgi:GAF domain-containing protein